MTANTLPKLLMESYKKFGESSIAMRRKDYGIWNEYTWKEYFENVKYFSLGLIKLGLETGDRMAIIGENDPEWFWAALAVQAAKGTAVGIFADSALPEAKYIIDHSECEFVIAEDQEQVDKILDIRKQGSKIRDIIYWDNKGLYAYEVPYVVYFYDIVASGKEYEKRHPDLFEKNVQEGKPKDIGTICYTSGTTGKHQKGALMTQEYLVGLGKAWTSVDPWEPGDVHLSYLSPAWGAEWCLGISSGLKSGAIVSFAEKPETVQANIRELGPKALFYNSRMWESVNSLIQAKMADSYAVNRLLYKLFLPIGYKVADLKFKKKKLGPFWGCLSLLAEWCLFKQLRDKIGLRNIKWAYTAGAGISPGIIRFFHAIGVNIKNFYGCTEVILITMPRDDSLRADACGTAFPGCEVKVSDDGEVLVKASEEMRFSGYLNDPEKTDALYNSEGYIKTGDAGFITENGQLVIMDRVASLMQLSDGRKFAADYIENRLRFSQYIKDALCIGGAKRDYITVLIIIDFENVGTWAERHHLAYTSLADLSQKNQILDLIMKVVKDVNEGLPDWVGIKKFLLLHKEFDPDEGELTRTRKIRRSYMEKKYGDLIAALYSEALEVVSEIPIQYRDGRKGVSKMNLKIKHVQ